MRNPYPKQWHRSIASRDFFDILAAQIAQLPALGVGDQQVTIPFHGQQVAGGGAFQAAGAPGALHCLAVGAGGDDPQRV
jgi:hypothetical protein